MGKLEDRLRRGPLFITLIYLCLGFAWILLSDRFAEQFAVGERALSFLQSVKGFLYVAGTGLILYLLLRSWRSQL
ncbi:MAG: hypothetical protein KGZ25_09890, partial [Planctomycetes bacterium]|nr:hypothetical protein [Planctomycetota bacterium]